VVDAAAAEAGADVAGAADVDEAALCVLAAVAEVEVDALAEADDVADVLLDELWLRATTIRARRTTPTITAKTTRADERELPSRTTGCEGIVLGAAGVAVTAFGAGVVETEVTVVVRAPVDGTGGITMRASLETATLFFATAFLAVAFLVADFLTVLFFATAFLATLFFATAFLATLFFATAFLAGAFLAATFFAALFFATAFLATAFLATTFFAAAFLAGAFLAVFLAALFFTATGALLKIRCSIAKLYVQERWE